MKKNIFEYIDNLAHNKDKRIVIWGAGETTKILCEITDIMKNGLLKIIDDKKAGELFYHYTLMKSSEIDFTCVDTVIISSINAQEEISDILCSQYLFQGEILKIYRDKQFLYEQPEFYEYMYKLYNKRIKEIGKKEIIKIGYITTQNELWNLQSFYEEVCKDKKFYFEVIALPNPENILESKRVSCNINYCFFKRYGIDVKYGYDFEKNRIINIEEWDYDILFWDQPGAWTNIFKEIPFYAFLKKFLICYVPYGYKVADGKRDHFDLNIHNLSWKIFAESGWHYEQFKKIGRIDGKNVVVTGFPKLDRYLQGCNNYTIWKNGKSSRKKVIWAPHWSFKNPGWEYSTFDKNYINFFEYASQNKEIDWILKPHQRLYFWCVQSGLMTEQEMKDYFEKWNELDNAIVYDGGNYMEMFMTSDALITDCGSFLAEYLPSKKPVIHLYNPNCKYNEIGQKIVESYYRCSNWSEIENAIEKVIISEEDYLKPKRLSMLKYVIPNQKGAGKAILQEIQSNCM